MYQGLGAKERLIQNEGIFLCGDRAVLYLDCGRGYTTPFVKTHRTGDTRHVHAQRKDHVRAQLEGGYLQARERGRTCLHLHTNDT